MNMNFFSILVKLINVSDTLKILEVSFDRMLTYKDDLTAQLNKAYAKTTALRRIRRFIPTNYGTVIQDIHFTSLRLLQPVVNWTREDPGK